MEEIIPKSASWMKIRYIQMTLLFFLMGLSYAIRTILSIAIVAMTSVDTASNEDVPEIDGKYSGVILSSFYWSYAVLQFFAGPIAHSFGAKWIMTLSMLVNSVTCMLIPLCSSYLGVSGVVACRVAQGIAQGFMLPLTHNMLGKWAPAEERSWINTTVYSGCSFGTILSMPITGYLSSTYLGWSASFYLFGVLGLIWCVFWELFGADRPATHKSIDWEERHYIESSLGQETEEISSNIKVPWKAIFTSLPYWAVIMGAIGESWGSTFLITEIPSYLSKVTDIDIERNGLYSSAPYVVAAVLTVLYGPLADYLILNGYTSRKTSRRIFHGIEGRYYQTNTDGAMNLDSPNNYQNYKINIKHRPIILTANGIPFGHSLETVMYGIEDIVMTGAFLPASALVWLAYEETRWGIAILLIVAISLNGAMFCGHNVNHIDISPRFSGVLFGISNGIGQTLAIFAPLLVQFVVYDETDKTLWRTMFIIAAIIYAASAAFFIAYLSADRQWWDAGRKSSRTDNEAEKLPEEVEKL